MKSTIAIVSIHPIDNEGMRLILQNHYPHKRVMVSENFHKLLSICATPDLIFLFSRTYNEESLRECRATFPSSLLIFYGNIGIEQISHLFSNSYISGYINEFSSLKELYNCVGTVLSGKKYLSSEYQVNLLRTEPTISIHNGTHEEKLTTREYEIATLFLLGHTTTYVAKILNLKPSTISTFKKKIFKKKNVTNIIQLAKIIKL